MEKLFGALKNDMKMASRTVKNARQTYLSLFVALFLIQTLFGIIGISEHNRHVTNRNAIKEKYDCHIEITNLNDADHYYLVNAEGRLIGEAVGALTEEYLQEGIQMLLEE